MPGLRREELARLAGVSASYYTRLEQGHSRGASAEVLDALARALRLGPDEHAHLRRLGEITARPGRRRPAPVEQVSEETLVLLEQMREVPALVQGRRADVLAWNDLGHALLAGHLDRTAPARPADRPNAARLVFLDAHTRELYLDWPRKARAMVGNLRLAAGRHPDDERLAALVGELSVRSAEFARLWAEHRVQQCDAAAYELRHPVVGAVTLTQQAFDVARSPDQTLILLTAAADSPSRHALKLLEGS